MGRSETATRLAATRLAACALVAVFLYAYSIPSRAALIAIDEYRAHVSPHLRGIVQCRFTPTCSWYGHEAIRKYGLLKGGAKTMVRIAKCGPWTKLGTHDEP